MKAREREEWTAYLDGNWSPLSLQPCSNLFPRTSPTLPSIHHFCTNDQSPRPPFKPHLDPHLNPSLSHSTLRSSPTSPPNAQSPTPSISGIPFSLSPPPGESYEYKHQSQPYSDERVCFCPASEAKNTKNHLFRNNPNQIPHLLISANQYSFPIPQSETLPNQLQAHYSSSSYTPYAMLCMYV